MRYGLLQEKLPKTLDIGLESFILGLGVFNEKGLPLGDLNSKIPGQNSRSYRVSQYSSDSVYRESDSVCYILLYIQYTVNNLK